MDPVSIVIGGVTLDSSYEECMDYFDRIQKAEENDREVQSQRWCLWLKVLEIRLQRWHKAYV